MTAYYAIDGRTYVLMHEGKKGMHWGERHYQYEDGSLTPLGYIHYGYTKRMRPAVEKAIGGLRAKAKEAGTSVKKAFEKQSGNLHSAKDTYIDMTTGDPKAMKLGRKIIREAEWNITKNNAKRAIKDAMKDFDRAKGEAAQPTAASRVHTAKAEAQARALHAKLAKARGDAKKLQKVAMKEALKNARKRAKEDAKIAKKDDKWIAKNGAKLIKQAMKNKAVRKELKAYEKELRERLRVRSDEQSPKLNYALNSREASLLNKYVSMKTPNGTAVTFIALRRERGIAVTAGNADRFRNGVYSTGTAAYTKEKARML